MENRHWSRWLVRVQLLLLAVLFVAGLLLRLELVHFRLAFQVFQFAGLAAVAVALLCMPVFMWGLIKRHAESRRAALWGVVLGLVPVAVPLLTVGKSNFEVPPIHDITTDMDNPPRYQAVLSLRKKSDNSTQYAGQEVAAQQRGADIYADIQPLWLAQPVEQATELAAQVAENMGWRLVAQDNRSGHLEAVDRTSLLGFTDDIVVRIRAEGGSSRVDVRSSSRVGRSDLGANARRIRSFLAELEARATMED